MSLTEAEMRAIEAKIREFAALWYRRLDQHVAIEEIAAMVAPDIEMHLPEGVLRGADGFAGWYRAVTGRFFDEVHELHRVAVSWRGEVALVAILVNWQARRWDPPAPRSQWIGFESDQSWELAVARSGDRWAIRIRLYVVRTLDPMPGSPPL